MNRQTPIVPAAVLHEPLVHDSAAKHVSGRAEYIDDMAEPAGTLHA
jgi:xanthine dehydrogenase large subunit